MERPAAKTSPHVYLETMEEAENQIPQPVEAGHSGVLRPDDSDEQTRLLVCGRNHFRGQTHPILLIETRYLLCYTYYSNLYPEFCTKGVDRDAGPRYAQASKQAGRITAPFSGALNSCQAGWL